MYSFSTCPVCSLELMQPCNVHVVSTRPHDVMSTTLCCIYTLVGVLCRQCLLVIDFAFISVHVLSVCYDNILTACVRSMYLPAQYNLDQVDLHVYFYVSKSTTCILCLKFE